MLDLVSSVSLQDGGTVGSPTRNFLSVDEGTNIEPHNGIEFESNEAAYKFYQAYAKSMGFTTSIRNSRRSKKSKDFIDVKFACSRYGITHDSDSAGSGRRALVKKTDCKASMHVKRNKLGKWVIHEFIKEHNHELLPALAYHFRIQRNVKLAEKNNVDILHAVSARTKKMYVEMSKQHGRCPSAKFSMSEDVHRFDNGSCLVLEEGDSQMLLDYFMRMRKENCQFFYAIDLNEEQQLRNLLWVDAKSRTEYVNFSDVVSFDTTYLSCSDKLPLVLFIGVNNHFQSMLLGCALVADQTTPTIVWLMKTWLRAMGGKAPQVILSDQQPPLAAAIEQVFPKSRHCFPLWCILEKVPVNLVDIIRRHEHFVRKLNKCVFKSWTDEQFEMRWWKMVGRFDLQEDDWVKSLYEDRRKWVPLYIGDAFLAGMSSVHRSESVNSFFDKYMHKRISVKEFMRQYGAILQNRREEDDMAEFDTWQKQPALKSPSPWEKQMSTVYTHAIFKKFQAEVLGVVGCHPKQESVDGASVTYPVEDYEIGETFFVAWNEADSELSCLCRSFQNKGFLCRHAMIILQLCGVSRIPSRYILRRWTKEAKNKPSTVQGTQGMQTRVKRYNDLCKQAIELSEEGSMSQETYNVVFHAMAEALKDCVNINNSNETTLKIGSKAYTLRDGEEDNLSTKVAKKKNAAKKRKVTSQSDIMISDPQDSLHQMLQLNLMEPPYDGYYENDQSMQGLGQLNPAASSHDEFFGLQHSVHGQGLELLDFRPSSSFTYGIQDKTKN